MAGKAAKDLYTNRSLATLTMDAADTLTFQQIRFGTGLFEGIALKLNRVEWHLGSTTIRQIVANTDGLNVALTTRDDLSNLDPTNLSVLCLDGLWGMGATVEPIPTPIVHDFSNLPNGGILIPANPLYMAMSTAGFASAGIVRIILYYQYVKLSPQENLELLQTIIPGTV